MNKLVPILDNGHGGVVNNVYLTPGKRSPKWSKGVLYEGMFNRWVVNRVIEILDRSKVPYFHASPEIKDVSLPTRVNRCNEIYKTNKNAYLISIHANAGGGTGIEGFTSVGHTKSDAIGEVFLSNIEKDFPEQRMRFNGKDGDKDKERNYYLLRKSNCPAFLLEAGFMDHASDYANLWSEDYLNRMAKSISKSIIQLYNS